MILTRVLLVCRRFEQFQPGSAAKKTPIELWMCLCLKHFKDFFGSAQPKTWVISWLTLKEMATFHRLDVPRLGGRASKRLNDRVRRRKWCLVALGSVEVTGVFMGCPWWVIGIASLDSQLGYMTLMDFGW